MGKTHGCSWWQNYHQKKTKMSLGQKSSNFCKFFTTEKKNDKKSVSSNHGQEKMKMNNKQDARNEPRYRTDCHTCMLVQMGEKANYHDLPCEECGRKQRSPYGLSYTKLS